MNASPGSGSTEHARSELAAQLVAVGTGDAAALRRVYDAVGGQLFAICLHVTRSHAGAEDVLQETFIKIWNRAPGYDPARSPMVWLGTIARNSAIDWYRAHHRRQFVGDDAISLLEDEAEPAVERIIREEREHRALDMLSELPTEQEQELRSIFFDGLTYTQLAERKKLPLATLKSRIRRALIALRSSFDDD